MSRRKTYDQLAMNERRRAHYHDQAAVWRVRERRNVALDGGCVGEPDRLQLDARRLRHGLKDDPLSDAGNARLPHHAHARDAGRDFLEQLEPFAGQAVFKLDEAGRIAAGSCHIVDEAVADRIDALGEHDRHGVGRLPQRRVGPADASQDDVRARRNHVICVSLQSHLIARAPADFDPHVAADLPARFLQPREDAARRACASGSSAAVCMSTPTRRTCSPCCARAAYGIAAAPKTRDMNSRRLMMVPRVRGAS